MFQGQIKLPDVMIKACPGRKDLAGVTYIDGIATLRVKSREEFDKILLYQTRSWEATEYHAPTKKEKPDGKRPVQTDRPEKVAREVPASGGPAKKATDDSGANESPPNPARPGSSPRGDGQKSTMEG